MQGARERVGPDTSPLSPTPISSSLQRPSPPRSRETRLGGLMGLHSNLHHCPADRTWIWTRRPREPRHTPSVKNLWRWAPEGPGAPLRRLPEAWGRTLEGRPLGQRAGFSTGLGGASLVPRTLSQIWEPGRGALPLSLPKPAVG